MGDYWQWTQTSMNISVWAIGAFPNRLELISNELFKIKLISWLFVTENIQGMSVYGKKKINIHE